MMKYAGCSALMMLATTALCEENNGAARLTLDTMFSSDLGFPVINSDLQQCQLKLELTYREDCDRPSRVARAEIEVDLTTVQRVTVAEVLGDSVVIFEGVTLGPDQRPIRTTGQYYYCDGTSFDEKQNYTWSFLTNSPPSSSMINELNDYIDVNCGAVEG